MNPFGVVYSIVTGLLELKERHEMKSSLTTTHPTEQTRAEWAQTQDRLNNERAACLNRDLPTEMVSSRRSRFAKHLEVVVRPDQGE